LVGEAGPEAIIPLGRGFKGGGGRGDTYVTVNVAGSVTSERDLARTVRDELVRTQNRNGLIF